MTQKERLIDLIRTAILSARTYCGMPSSADVADFLLANGVVVLPCKVGDKVLYYDVFDRKINEKTVDAFCIDKGGICVSLEGYPILQTAYFRTPEEAEAALEKMKGE